MTDHLSLYLKCKRPEKQKKQEVEKVYEGLHILQDNEKKVMVLGTVLYRKVGR